MESSSRNSEDFVYHGNINALETFLKFHWDFRFNVVLARVEFRNVQIPGARFKALESYDINTINRKLKKAGINVPIEYLRGTFCSDLSPKYNPLREYFSGLPIWDEEIDFIDLLSRTIETTHDAFWRNALKKWLVGLVASIIEDGIINHQMLILSGRQGVGKTKWLRKLIPASLTEYYYSGQVFTNDKDSLVQLSENMLIIIDEVQSLSGSALYSLKEIITRASVKIRRPYAHVHETYPRRASFAGTTNEKEILHDTTGSRRFLTIEVISINLDHDLIDGVFSQALALYKKGFRYWFDQEENEAITRSNEEFRYKSVEEELLLKYFKPGNIQEDHQILTTSDILHIILTTGNLNSNYIGNNAQLQRLGKALKLHKFARVKSKGRWAWIVQQIDDQEPGSASEAELGESYGFRQPMAPPQVMRTRKRGKR